MKKAVTYNYSATEILERGAIVAELAQRDIQHLEKYGMSQKDIDILLQKLEEYKEYPEDTFFSQRVKEQTKEKNEQEARLVNLVRNFFLMFSIIVPTKKETKKYFPTQKLTGIKTFELVEIAERVIVVYRRFKERLARYNVTEKDMADLRNEITSTKKVVKTLESVRLERTRNTQRRKELGKTLYEKIAMFSHYGKTFWKDLDDSRYKDYLLYEKTYLEQKQRNRERDQMLKAKELARRQGEI